MDGLLKDIRYAARGLVRQPVFSALVILILALGIAGNACIFSVVNALVLRPLTFEDPDHLIHLQSSIPKKNVPTFAISPPEYLDYKQQSSVFEGIGLYMGQSETFNLTGDQDPLRLAGRRVTANLLPILGVEPALGRNFSAEEESGAGDQVVILTDRLFQRRFGGDDGLIQRTILLNEIPHVVIGVLPADFVFASAEVEIWLPLGFEAASIPRRNRQFRAVGRLKDDATLAQARAEMETIASRLEKEYPATNTDFEAHVQTLYQQIFGPNFARTWTVALIAAFSLFVIASANIVNLLLTRAMAREREFAVRAALGAGKWRMIRPYLVEGVVLALPGAVLAIVLANWGIRLLTAFLPADMPRAGDITLDGKVLAFTIFLALLTALVSGLLPGIVSASRRKLASLLCEGSRGSSSRSGHAMRALVVVEIALALVLLVATALLIESFQKLQQVDRGINTQGVLAMRLTAPQEKYPEPQQLVSFLSAAIDEIRAQPGVVSAAVINELPATGYINWATTFTIRGEPAPPPGQENLTHLRIVGSQYFQTLGIERVRGRDFSSSLGIEDPWVGAVNKTLVEKYFGGADPIGKIVTIQTGGGPVEVEIIAIVGDVHQEGPRRQLKPSLYLSYRQRPIYTTSLAVRTESDPTALVSSIRSAIARIDPGQPLFRIHTLEAAVAEDTTQERALANLLGVLVVMALILTAAGLYGVMAYNVAQRRREVGIRLALGARRRSVVQLVVKQGLLLLAVGLTVGVLASLASSRLLAPLLFQMDPFDPWILIAVMAILMVISVLASLLPARRAASISPVETLRFD